MTKKDEDDPPLRSDLILLKPDDVERVTHLLGQGLLAQNAPLPAGYILLTPNDVERMTALGRDVQPQPPRREKFRSRTGIEHEIDPDHGAPHDLLCDGGCGTVMGVRQLPKELTGAAIKSGLLCVDCAEAMRAREAKANREH